MVSGDTGQGEKLASNLRRSNPSDDFPQISTSKSKSKNDKSAISGWISYCGKFLLVMLGLTILFSLPFGYLLVTRLGFGKLFPAQPLSKLSPLLPESVLEVVGELPVPPGNIAVSKSNRIFFTFHPEYSDFINVNVSTT